MTVKTKTCSIGPLKGTLPKDQGIFGRESSLRFPEHAAFVDFPINLRALLELIEKQELTYQGVQVKEGRCFLVFRPSAYQLPKGLGKYVEHHGKEKLHFDGSDSNLF